MLYSFFEQKFPVITSYSKEKAHAAKSIRNKLRSLHPDDPRNAQPLLILPACDQETQSSRARVSLAISFFFKDFYSCVCGDGYHPSRPEV